MAANNFLLEKPHALSEEIGRNVHAHSVRFPWTRFSVCQSKDAHQNLFRETLPWKFTFCILIIRESEM